MKHDYFAEATLTSNLYTMYSLDADVYTITRSMTVNPLLETSVSLTTLS